MEEHDERASELERDAERLGAQSDEVQRDIDDVRSDFEQKLGDQQAPGLQEEEAAAPGGLGEEEEQESEEEQDDRVDDERENVDAQSGGPA